MTIKISKKLPIILGVIIILMGLFVVVGPQLIKAKGKLYPHKFCLV